MIMMIQVGRVGRQVGGERSIQTSDGGWGWGGGGGGGGRSEEMRTAAQQDIIREMRNGETGAYLLRYLLRYLLASAGTGRRTSTSPVVCVGAFCWGDRSQLAPTGTRG